MARLSDDEKAELLRVAHAWSRPDSRSRPEKGEPPSRRLLTPREYIEFATFASRFDRSRKPVDFRGENWKL